MTRPQRPKPNGAVLGPAVVVVGEALCDLFAPGPDLLVPLIGGAPANVAVQLARQGAPVELTTAVGGDPLGARVLALLAAEGVGLRAARTLPDRRTGLCYVEVAADGERTFFPWRDRSADLAMGPAHVDAQLLSVAPIVHRGTVSQRSPSARACVAAALRAAPAAIRALDVNLRFKMFPSRERLLQAARREVARSHAVKATDDEARALYGSARPRRLMDEGPRLVAITKGARGATLANRRAVVDVEAPPVRVVDATGAGDAFWGVVLAELWRRRATQDDLDDLSKDDLRAIGAAACAAGAAACTALGATTAMPFSGRSPSS
jgi:fructokinase